MQGFDDAPLYPFISSHETETADVRVVYIVRDDREERRAAIASLRFRGFETRPFGTIQDFLDALAELKPGCLILDSRATDSAIPHLIDLLGDRRADFSVVVAIRQDDVASAVQAMKAGVSDVAELPLDYALLPDLLDPIFARLEQSSPKRKSVRNARMAVRALTSRECDILRGLVAGLNNKQLAHRLGLSLRTVEAYRGSMMDRLQVHTLAGALRIAFESEVDPLLSDTA